MINIKHIINNYYIGKDRFNYIIYERSIITKEGKNKGKEQFTAIGYYGKNIKQLKRGLLNKVIFDEFMNVDTDKLLNDLDKLILKMKEIE